MADVPMFTVDTTRRCFAASRSSPGAICGARACWMVPPVNGSGAEFFCDAHRRLGVAPIDLDAPYRRISLMVEVLCSAAALVPATAHREAVTVVLDALARLGTVPNLIDVTSTVGRYTGSPAPRKAIGPRDRP